MSNVKVNGTTYNNVASVKLPLAAGGGFATYAEANYQEKTVTSNGVVTPDSGYSALSKVTVNVPTSGTIKEASGTISALSSDQMFLKVTGLSFTPKAFRIAVIGTAEVNSTGSYVFVRGTWAAFRTSTGGTGLTAFTGGSGATDVTAKSDTYEPTAYGCAVHILEHGFAVVAHNGAFPFREGMLFEWYAVG